MRAWPFVVAIAVACGGTPTVPTAPIAPAPIAEASQDPACPMAGKIELPADGQLRCRELPFLITFPPGTKLARSNEQTMALFNAELERGVMALVAEPRADAPDSARIAVLLGNLARGIAADSTTAPAEAPKLDGASVSAALTFTTPDGGLGVVHGYYANHWLIAVVVGGRLATTPTRPDMPIAKSFLASLRIRPLPTGTARHPLAGGAYVDLPATAWSSGPLPPQDNVRSEYLMLVPDRGVWVGVRELEARDRCDFIRDAGSELAERLKTVYSNSQYPLQNIERGKFGDVSAYAQAATEDRKVALYFMCAGKTVVQLSVVGDKPIAQLRALLDEVAKSLVGAE